MALILILAVTIAAFAYIGRASMPSAERPPVSSWGIRDLARNVWLGLVECSVNTPLDRAMEEMVPHRDSVRRHP